MYHINTNFSREHYRLITLVWQGLAEKFVPGPTHEIWMGFNFTNCFPQLISMCSKPIPKVFMIYAFVIGGTVNYLLTKTYVNRSLPVVFYLNENWIESSPSSCLDPVWTCWQAHVAFSSASSPTDLVTSIITDRWIKSSYPSRRLTRVWSCWLRPLLCWHSSCSLLPMHWSSQTWYFTFTLGGCQVSQGILTKMLPN